ncbi:MAG: hypothetical protein JRF33_08435 [Deltaproteobacteria bacterium]|nr:hypothetical protein [Deltaproteobacteria bacterium]
MDTSTWAAPGCGLGQPSDARHMGDFGVGNGHVFALSGYACPLNTLHTMAGPDYQQEGAFFPDTWMELWLDGEAQEVKAGFLYRVRAAPILISHERGDLLEWFTITWAPAGLDDDDPLLRTILRTIVVRNLSDDTLSGIFLRHENAAQVKDGRRRSLVALLPAEEEDASEIGLDALSPGQEVALVLAYVTSQDELGESATISALRQADLGALLDATHEHWRLWSERSAQLDCPDPRVADLLDGMRVTVRSQQTYLGGISPMSRYSLMWIRDTAGAVRYFLRLGLFEEARAMLDYYYLGAIIRGDISNALALDYAPAEPPVEPDWASLPPFSGRTEGETPSYLPIMANWYAEATGDDSLIDAQYEFLRRALLAQHIDEQGLIPFSGDETYRGAMAMTLGLAIEHDWVSCCPSANSSFLFVAGAEALAGQADRRGKSQDAEELMDLAERVRRAADAAYWDSAGYWRPYEGMEGPVPPYEDVSTKPYWTGFARAADEKALENLESVIGLLGQDDGFLQSPLHDEYVNYMGTDITQGVYTGMMPGYFLYNLAMTDHPMVEKAFDALASAASPSGNYAEYQVYDDHSALQVIYEQSGTLGDLTARYRPWEGAICLDALVFYLTGFEPRASEGLVALAPRLPNDWPRMEWRGLRFGDVRFDLLVEELGGQRRITVTPQGRASLNLDLAIPLGEVEVTRVELRGRRVEASDYGIRELFGLPRLELGVHEVSGAEALVVTVWYQ